MDLGESWGWRFKQCLKVLLVAALTATATLPLWSELTDPSWMGEAWEAPLHPLTDTRPLTVAADATRVGGWGLCLVLVALWTRKVWNTVCWPLVFWATINTLIAGGALLRSHLGDSHPLPYRQSACAIATVSGSILAICLEFAWSRTYRWAFEIRAEAEAKGVSSQDLPAPESPYIGANWFSKLTFLWATPLMQFAQKIQTNSVADIRWVLSLVVLSFRTTARFLRATCA